MERFWSKVEKAGPEECWEWTAHRDRHGYGQFRLGGMQKAHRVAYEMATGQPIPDGMCVCHSCDNPPCVNPAHLFLGTHTENIVDMYAKGRWVSRHSANAAKTECPHGHPYDEANTRIGADGHRACRACNREAVRRYKERAR